MRMRVYVVWLTQWGGALATLGDMELGVLDSDYEPGLTAKVDDYSQVLKPLRNEPCSTFIAFYLKELAADSIVITCVTLLVERNG